MSNYTMSPVVNGEKKQMIVKVGDTSPIGGIIGYDTTQTIPDGWEYYAENQIKKIAPVTPANGNIKNSYGTSQTDTYSQEYINDNIYTADEIFSNNTGVTLDLNDNRTFNLTKNSLDYKYIEIVYSIGNIMASTGKIPCINQGRILFNVLFLATTDTIQQRTLVVRNNGTSLYLERASYINAQVGGGFSVNTNSGSCSIHRVILYN